MANLKIYADKFLNGTNEMQLLENDARPYKNKQNKYVKDRVEHVCIFHVTL